MEEIHLTGNQVLHPVLSGGMMMMIDLTSVLRQEVLCFGS